MEALINNIALNTNVSENKLVKTNNKSYLLNETIKDSVEFKNKTANKAKKIISPTEVVISASIGVLSAIGIAKYKARFARAKKPVEKIKFEPANNSQEAITGSKNEAPQNLDSSWEDILENTTLSKAKLAKKIKFEPAKNLQEAIKFAKEKLGIDRVIGFEEKDLEVLNWANRGFVNVVNAHNGELRMPNVLSYSAKELKKREMAGVINDIKSPYDGYFAINKTYVDNIDNNIEELIEKLMTSNHLLLKEDGTLVSNSNFVSEQIVCLLKRHKEKTLNFLGKVYLSHLNIYYNNAMYQGMRTNVKSVIANKEYVKILEEAGIDAQKLLGPFSNDIGKKYAEIFYKIIKEKNIKVSNFKNSKMSLSPYRTIYHEMGHLQDIKRRSRSVAAYNFDESKYPKELQEWIKNKDDIDAASEISRYASLSPCEFIAEAFAEMISGNTLSDKAMSLYKKLGGPSIPNIV